MKSGIGFRKHPIQGVWEETRGYYVVIPPVGCHPRGGWDRRGCQLTVVKPSRMLNPGSPQGDTSQLLPPTVRSGPFGPSVPLDQNDSISHASWDIFKRPLFFPAKNANIICVLGSGVLNSSGLRINSLLALFRKCKARR